MAFMRHLVPVIIIFAFCYISPSSSYAEVSDETTLKELERSVNELKEENRRMHEQLDRQEREIQKLKNKEIESSYEEGYDDLEDDQEVSIPWYKKVGTGVQKLNPDISLAIDGFAAVNNDAANIVDPVEYGNDGEGIFFREAELRFTGSVDPWIKGEVTIGMHGDHVHLESAYAVIDNIIPWGVRARMGKFRTAQGLTNVKCTHDLEYFDRPPALVTYFGEHGLIEAGFGLSWMVPIPSDIFGVELIAQVIAANNDHAFDIEELTGTPGVVTKIATFAELPHRLGFISIGGSFLAGPNGEVPVVNKDIWSYFQLVDFIYRYSDHLYLTSEVVFSERELIPGDTIFSFGLYGNAEFYFRDLIPNPWLHNRLSVGVRYDYVEDPYTGQRSLQAINPHISYWLSERARFRMQYSHAWVPGLGDSSDEVIFQYTFFLGPHLPHL